MGCWCPRSAAQRLLGQLVALGVEHRVAGLGRPRGGRHGELGLLARRDDHPVGAVPDGRALETVDVGGLRVGVRAADRGRLVAPGLGDVSDPDHLGAVGRLRAGRVQRGQRVGARRGQAPAVREQDRGAYRRAHQHGGGDRALPVAAVHERDRQRSRGGGGPGIDRARRPGGVGRGIRAADPGRVLGREGGEAEGAGGRLVAALLADHRALADLGLVLAAAGRGERGAGEQGDGKAAGH